MSDDSLMGLGLFGDTSVPLKCTECGNTDINYEGLGSYKCNKCGHLMYDDYGKVREYLDAHRGATAVEVSAATGVSQSKIRQMLKDEKLEITPGSAMFIFCEKCGTPIRSGRFCDSCASDRAKSLSSAKSEPVTKSKMQGFGASRSDSTGAKRYTRH